MQPQAIQDELKQMMAEVKRKLKPQSKNELIRTIGALLLDNYALKMQLAELTQNKESENNEKA